MAVATGTALLGSAALGTAGSIYAGNRASSAQRQAGQQAADSQLQATRESNALQERMFNQSLAMQAPWHAAGTQALGAMQGFMGMPSTATATPANQPSYAPQSAAQYGPQPTQGAPGGAMQTDGRALNRFDLGMEREFGRGGVDGGLSYTPAMQAAANPQGGAQYAAAQQKPMDVSQPAPVNPQSSFDAFRNSINYDFTRQQGENALQRLLARSGQVNSGRGMTAAMDYGQNAAHSLAIGPYMNQLNSMAGIGQNAAMTGGNQAMNLAGMMGGNIMAGGNAQANAFMNAGNARASAYQNTGNAFGNLLNQGAQIYGMQQAGYFNNQGAKMGKGGYP